MRALWASRSLWDCTKDTVTCKTQGNARKAGKVKDNIVQGQSLVFKCIFFQEFEYSRHLNTITLGADNFCWEKTEEACRCYFFCQVKEVQIFMTFSKLCRVYHLRCQETCQNRTHFAVAEETQAVFLMNHIFLHEEEKTGTSVLRFYFAAAHTIYQLLCLWDAIMKMSVK